MWPKMTPTGFHYNILLFSSKQYINKLPGNFLLVSAFCFTSADRAIWIHSFPTPFYPTSPQQATKLKWAVAALFPNVPPIYIFSSLTLISFHFTDFPNFFLNSLPPQNGINQQIQPHNQKSSDLQDLDKNKLEMKLLQITSIKRIAGGEKTSWKFPEMYE